MGAVKVDYLRCLKLGNGYLSFIFVWHATTQTEHPPDPTCLFLRGIFEPLKSLYIRRLRWIRLHWKENKYERSGSRLKYNQQLLNAGIYTCISARLSDYLDADSNAQSKWVLVVEDSTLNRHMWDVETSSPIPECRRGLLPCPSLDLSGAALTWDRWPFQSIAWAYMRRSVWVSKGLVLAPVRLGYTFLVLCLGRVSFWLRQGQTSEPFLDLSNICLVALR